MIDHLPIWISILFMVIVCGAIAMFYMANGKSKKLIGLIIVWTIVQSILGVSGFYQVLEGMPPRVALILFPMIGSITYGLLPRQVNWTVEQRDLRWSTIFHAIRIPMEVILLHLFINKMIPELMTFEGRNFDIVAGLTAPIMYWFYLKNRISKRVLLAWNVLGLCLILFIFFNGLFSVELPFQLFGFEQPNRALLYFPFILLPATVVPMVIYLHVTDIIKIKSELSN